LLSLNSTAPASLVELFKVSRVWWRAKYKSTILFHQHETLLKSLLL
jgi:hypothetical protein